VTNGEPWSLEGLEFGVAEDPFHGLEEYGSGAGQRSTGLHGVEPVSRKRIGQRRSKIFPPFQMDIRFVGEGMGPPVSTTAARLD
jgi:hypothetical protein